MTFIPLEGLDGGEALYISQYSREPGGMDGGDTRRRQELRPPSGLFEFGFQFGFRLGFRFVVARHWLGAKGESGFLLVVDWNRLGFPHQCVHAADSRRYSLKGGYGTQVCQPTSNVIFATRCYKAKEGNDIRE